MLDWPICRITYNSCIFSYRDRKYIAFCTSGYRSVIASSILRSRGYNVVDVHGGFAAISVYNPETTTTGKVI